MTRQTPKQCPVTTRDRLDRLCRDLCIEAADSFRIGDGPSVRASSAAQVPSAGPVMAGPTATYPALRDALATAIYVAAYARRYDGPGYDPASFERTLRPDATFVAALEAANSGRAAWEPGWRVFACDADGSVHVAKGDTPQKLLPGRFAMRDLLRPPRPGDEVERRRERSSLTHQPGLYHAFGEAPRNDYDEARIARFYFDVRADQAAWLLATLSSLLNRFCVPFTYKCPVHPASYDRLDAGVLYVARRHVPAVADLLIPLARDFERRLGGAVPLWTLPVLPGVGAADDPGTGESFGQSRSGLVAAALVDAWTDGRSDVPSRTDAIAARFRAARLSVDSPHLGAGLAEVYESVTEGVS